ncbi:hypothetical protein ACET3Z_021236 [Daucus carota]
MAAAPSVRNLMYSFDAVGEERSSGANKEAVDGRNLEDTSNTIKMGNADKNKSFQNTSSCCKGIFLGCPFKDAMKR